jgi:hypothetical protein
MKRTFKILGVIATVLAVVALAAPASYAQCQQTRNFGGFGGKTGATVVIDASGFQNTGGELAQFWQTGTPANGTGTGQVTSTCPSQGVAGVANPWWGIHAGTGHRIIRGIVSAGGCLLPLNCPPPGASLSWLVEDQTADGSGAGVVMYEVDETPPSNNWYDIGRTDPNAIPGVATTLVHTMGSLPTVFVTQANGTPPNTTATNDYAEDMGILFHGVTGAANTPLPGSAMIDSYDVMSFSGADPGRNRSLWTFVKSITYVNASILADSVAVPCTGDVNTVLAIGLTLDGSVPSSLVGPASVPIACDPALAEPTPKVRRPAVQRKPVGRSGR